ncbi:MAG TPA: bifunctional diguanylate cyclase/phosphodiesterase [Cellulomonadaceae bacterium]|nr:bifunctional diguanylate cyclase/phosphodiesterase [Cellulomonadaceae bacterium]
MTATWRAYLIASVAAAALVAVAQDGPWRAIAVFALVAASVAATVVGVRVNRPPVPVAWYLLAAGLGSSATGQLILAVSAHRADAYPSVADAFFLAAYPLLFAALFLVVTGGRWRLRVDAVLDASIVGTTACMILWVLVVSPTWTAAQGTLAARLVGTAYPVGDLVLLLQLLRVSRAVRVRNASTRLLLAAGAVFVVADLAVPAAPYVLGVAAGVRFLDAGWIVGHALLAAAALHPAMARFRTPAAGPVSAIPYTRVMVVGAAILVLPLSAALADLFHLSLHLERVAGFRVTLMVLVAVRAGGLLTTMRSQSVRLARLASTDFLTGADNSHHFVARLTDVVDDTEQAAGAQAVVLYVGIERFGELNDTLGHRTGDELLRAVATRLAGTVAAGGCVARLGGDVFGVLVPGDPTVVASALAVGLRQLVDQPFQVSDVRLTIDCSVGYVVAGEDGRTALDLLRRADLALAFARTSPGRVARYAPSMDREGVLAPVLMAELPHALDDDQLVVHYQPQVEATSGRVIGVEALVRWQHPEHGLLGPAAFIPAAESTGLIRSVTLFVLDRSLDQCARWGRDGLELNVSVNLSVRDLLDQHLVEDVRAALARHGVDASRLELEVTETIAMVDPVSSIEVLSGLARLGVQISVDDYGTGYSSLAYLQQLPVGRLKIDRSFVTDLVRNDASAMIVRSTIDLARNLGLDVVAEGVEDHATMRVLQQMACFALQGFGLGRPVPADELPGLVLDIAARWPSIDGPVVPVQRGPHARGRLPVGLGDELHA